MCNLRHLPAVLAVLLSLLGEPGRQRTFDLRVPAFLRLHFIIQRLMQFGIDRTSKWAGPNNIDAMAD